jgi:hypothetical protein
MILYYYVMIILLYYDYKSSSSQLTKNILDNILLSNTLFVRLIDF